MSKFKNEHQQFRHRGFICSVCGQVEMMFGNDPAPTVCFNAADPVHTAADGSAVPYALTKGWDQDVVQTIVVTAHVEA